MSFLYYDFKMLRHEFAIVAFFKPKNQALPLGVDGFDFLLSFR